MQFSKTDLDNAIVLLATCEFFPTDGAVRAAIQVQLAKMCPSREALDWLVETQANRVGKWHGLKELRGLLCTRYKPADGAEEYCSLPGFTAEDSETAYIAEHETAKLAAPRGPRLLSGEVAAADPELTTTLEGAYQAITGRNLARDRHRKAEEPPPIVLPAPCLKCTYGRLAAGGYCDCRIGQELARLGG